MQQYRNMFNACRVPFRGEDYTAKHSHDNTRILIIRKNKFYTFDAGDADHRLTVEEIELYVSGSKL